MIVMHSTSAKAWSADICSAGIAPLAARGATGNWCSGVGSNAACVYFTTRNYSAEWFAFRAALASDDDAGLVLTFDTDGLEQSALRVDENLLDLEQRGHIKNCPRALRRRQRDAAVADARWKESLDRTGMASYAGTVPADRLSVARRIPVADNPYLVPEMLERGFDRVNRLKAHDWFVHYYHDQDEAGWSKFLRGFGIRQRTFLPEIAAVWDEKIRKEARA